MQPESFDEIKMQVDRMGDRLSLKMDKVFAEMISLQEKLDRMEMKIDQINNPAEMGDSSITETPKRYH